MKIADIFFLISCLSTLPILTAAPLCRWEKNKEGPHKPISTQDFSGPITTLAISNETHNEYEAIAVGDMLHLNNSAVIQAALSAISSKSVSRKASMEII